MVRLKQFLALILSWGILLATSPVSAAPTGGMYQEAPPANLTASQIDALVAPIALYPDALVAQVLAASTFPNEVVEADQWLKDNQNLQGTALAEAVNKQPWDPSVQALTQFPSVLDNMANNLSWTSALGSAFYNQQADVMASVQRLRQQAQAAGNLKTTPQQTVTTETQSGQQVIVIQPASPQVVYVPTYNPTVVYGTPYYPPGYSTGAVVATGLISFGVGMAVGAAMSGGCCGWGWNSWGCGWHGGTVVYNRNTYVSRSNIYANGNRYNNGNWARATPYNPNRNNYNRSGNRNTNVSGNNVNINTSGNRTNNINANNGNRTNNANTNNINRNTNNVGNRSNNGNNNVNRQNVQNKPGQNNANRPSNSQYRGYGQGQQTGTKSGAFSGNSAGGNARADSNRGRASAGGGGGNRGGGGGGNRGGGGGRRR
ncbi:MAG: DUF3300 domain-containing protein [Candidatus Korobacteraceae bacterium]